MLSVLNRHHLKGIYPPQSLYIGRGTALGNPFPITPSMNREQVVMRHSEWLNEQLEALDAPTITALRGLHEGHSLVCSCAPHPCHGQAIAQAWADKFQNDTWLRQRLQARPRTMAYAGIGSRTTPAVIQRLMSKVATRLAAHGYTLRSGAADGADSAFELGCPDGAKKEIFLPWRSFNNNPSPLFSVTEKSLMVASSVHPAWQKLTESPRKLMARNGYQILGENLDSPVDFVVCWTPDAATSELERTQKTGGTGQAIALASRWCIPVFNLAHADALQQIAEYLHGQSAQRQSQGSEPPCSPT